jgi:hypothetical protein
LPRLAVLIAVNESGSWIINSLATAVLVPNSGNGTTVAVFHFRYSSIQINKGHRPPLQ